MEARPVTDEDLAMFDQRARDDMRTVASKMDGDPMGAGEALLTLADDPTLQLAERVGFNADTPAFTPVEAVRVPDHTGIADCIDSTPKMLSEIELMHLATGGTLWLSCHGGLPAHRMFVVPKEAAR